jgi:short-subunit dehydrogenase
MRLDGRVVLITGAGSGIGRALAIAVAARRARLILVGRTMERLSETGRLAGEGAVLDVVPADVSTATGRARIHKSVGGGKGLDVLVNNAGQVLVGPIESTSDRALEEMVLTNVVAPIALTRELLPFLRASSSSRIVNIGSMFGDIAHPMFAAYSASKFAIRGLSDALRRELASEDIRVTYVAPRATRTSAADAFAHLAESFGMTFDEPAKVARQIVSAIEHDRPRAYARGLERVFVGIQRIAPSLLDRPLAVRARRALRSGHPAVQG